MLEPLGVLIDPTSGDLSHPTGGYATRLSALSEAFADQAALQARVRAEADPIVYKVAEYRERGSDLFFGTTTMMPGSVAGEFHMTRGHHHARPDMAEIYYTQSGSGLLLLESRGGETREVEMKPGVCAFIPPGWGHRSVNVGATKLVFVWCCNQDAGYDYGDIRKSGMRKRVVESDDGYRIIENS